MTQSEVSEYLIFTVIYFLSPLLGNTLSLPTFIVNDNKDFPEPSEYLAMKYQLSKMSVVIIFIRAISSLWY